MLDIEAGYVALELYMEPLAGLNMLNATQHYQRNYRLSCRL